MILFLIMLWIAGRLIYRWKFENKAADSHAARLTSSESAR